MTQTPNLAGLSAADRPLHQRPIVLGQEVDDTIANKLCAELLLLSAEDAKNVMLRLIAEHTGQPVERIERDSRRDRWFTAEEARDYGFVDQVLSDVADVTHAARPVPRSGWGRKMNSYTIPSVVEKTVRAERAVDIYSRLLTDRIVYIGTEIDDGVANVGPAQREGSRRLTRSARAAAAVQSKSRAPARCLCR